MGLTTAEAANRLGLTPRQVSRLCKEGILEAQKRGRAWDVDLASVEAYAKNPRKPGPPKGQGGRPRLRQVHDTGNHAMDTSQIERKTMSEKLTYFLKQFTTWFFANIFGFCALGLLLTIVPSMMKNMNSVIAILVLTIPISLAQWVALRKMQGTSILWSFTIPLGLFISVLIFQRFPEGIVPGLDSESVGILVAGYLLAGLIIGLLQWIILRRRLAGSSLWLLASSIGAAAGLWFVLVTDLINKNGLASIILWILLYSMITGVFLSGLLLRNKHIQQNSVTAV